MLKVGPNRETQLARNTLVNVLREAQEAHHRYEVKLQSPDPLWPEWYADYILATVTITPRKPEPVRFQCASHLPFRDESDIQSEIQGQAIASKTGY